MSMLLKLRAVLQAYGAENIKRRLWNAEFSHGRWNCLDSSPGDLVYPYIEKYARMGSILDLGCGSGSTGNELDATAYGEYIGVDISDLAIEKARLRTEENRRADKNKYYQADISKYSPNQEFDVILFRDSIYYVPDSRIKAMLERYLRYLKEDGVFIVRMWSIEGKYMPIVDMIEGNFEIVEKFSSGEPRMAIIVFRPRCRQ